MGTIRNIVFDFGGVLIDLKRSSTIAAMQKLGITDFDKELSNNYSCDGFLGQYEKGLITTPEFRNIIRQKACNCSLADIVIDNAWCALMQDVPTYKLELLLQLKKRFRIYMLSNTNELHIRYSLKQCFEKGNYTVSDYFDRLFFSYEMHLSKPDLQIFQSFITESGVIPEETLYIDDAPVNIKAGNECRLQSRLYIPGDDLTQLFRNEGLLN